MKRTFFYYLFLVLGTLPSIACADNKQIELKKAIERQQYDLIRSLLDQGVRLNSSGDSIPPLSLASFLGDTRMVQMLLDARANVNEYYNNQTPLSYAALGRPFAYKGNRRATITLLLDHGANPMLEIEKNPGSGNGEMITIYHCYPMVKEIVNQRSNIQEVVPYIKRYSDRRDSTSHPIFGELPGGKK